MDNNLISLLISPFQDYIFMRRALVACVSIALSNAPLGVILIQRRMSLMGEALSHGILPGIAIAYIFLGMWLPGLTIGGMIAGLTISLISGLTSRKTILKEDASFSSFYIIAFSLGVLLLSIKGGNMHLMHLLFGNVLGVNSSSLLFIAATSSLTLVLFMVIYRPLVYDCFDSLFMQSVGVKSNLYHNIFLGLVVCNLVAACQALGTLMALGIMIVPAATARLLSNRLFIIFLFSIFLAVVASYVGLILSYYFNWPSGPTIILVAGIIYIFVVAAKLLCNKTS